MTSSVSCFLMVGKAKFHRMKTFALLAAAIAFAGVGYAADPPRPSPPSPAVERDADAGQSGAAARPARQNPTGREFEPPPVPEFMLRKPAQPLTVEEMRRQADEAAEKARRARGGSTADSPNY